MQVKNKFKNLLKKAKEKIAADKFFWGFLASSVLVPVLVLCILSISDGKATHGLNYKLMGDGTFGVSVGDAFNESEIVIPKSRFGIPVSCVMADFFDIGEDSARWNADGYPVDAVSVRLPEGLKEIQAGAFKGAVMLTEINFPASLEVIGANAFMGCSQLKTADASKCNALNSIPNGCFSGCYKLKKVELPRNISFIGNIAFRNCYSLYDISLPDTVTVVTKGFEGCYSLRSVRLPATHTFHDSSEEKDFGGCYGVIEAFWDGSPSSAAALDVSKFPIAHLYGEESSITVREDGFGVVYEDGKPYVVGYFGDGDIAVLPDSIDGGSYGIYSYAFYGNIPISVTVSAGVDEIRGSAFWEREAHISFVGVSEWTVDTGDACINVTVDGNDKAATESILTLYGTYKWTKGGVSVEETDR